METNRINPGDQEPEGTEPEVKIMMLNIIDVVGQFAKTLNDQVPVEDIPVVIMAVCGTLAENITTDTWAKLLEIKNKPCGEPECDCHIYTNSFLPELHNLKVVADKGKERIRNEQGRGLN
jgi:hypothetical protein